MAISAEYLDFIKEQLADFGPVTVRRMFGGAGIYRDGLMFALLDNDILYFKADETSKGEFEALALYAFTYRAKGERRVALGYWRAPEACLDDPDEMALWARKAFAAALRARKPEKVKAARPGGRRKP